MPRPHRTGYATANGLQLYYEVYGSGDPLILLHGGFGSIEMFAPLLQKLAAGRQVIAFDLQGHGRTADVARQLSFEGMADDLVAAFDHLGCNNVDAMGYSLGGGVALQLAIRHPGRIKRLVVVSFPFRKTGRYLEMRDAIAQMGSGSADAMIGSPLHQAYGKLAPRPEDWTSLHIKMRDLLTRDYDWATGIEAITTPTLLVAGDADQMPPSHVAEFFERLGGGHRDGGWDRSGISSARLAILPGVTHYDILTTPRLAEITDHFLSAPVPITTPVQANER